MNSTINNTRPLRVLQVTARYYPFMGGVETHVYEVSRRMAHAGVDVTVLTTDPGRKLPAAEEHEGVHVRRVPAWPADRDYHLAPAIYGAIANGDWDIVHCQCYHTLVPPLAMAAALRAGIPYVLSFHSGGNSSAVRNVARSGQIALLRPLLVRARRLIAVSNFEADYFGHQLHLPKSKIVVIPNGSHLPKVDNLDAQRDPGLILSVGRLERYKGHHRVLEAMPAVLQQRPDVRLRIVGAGPYEQELRQIAVRLGVSDRVEIGSLPPSDRQAMARTLKQAGLVVLLSEYEAHPISVMESLAMGCSVLVADTSGLSELAERGLVRSIPLNSTPDQVAAAMLQQLRHPLLPAAVDLPTWENCTAELLDLYGACSDRSLAAVAARELAVSEREPGRVPGIAGQTEISRR